MLGHCPHQARLPVATSRHGVHSIRKPLKGPRAITTETEADSTVGRRNVNIESTPAASAPGISQPSRSSPLDDGWTVSSGKAAVNGKHGAQPRSSQLKASSNHNVAWGPPTDDGGPRIFSPYWQRPGGQAVVESLPILFFLPGIDGTGLAAYRQFPDLANYFDLRALMIPPLDRTSFVDLVALVKGHIEQEAKDFALSRPVYLLGESFGGLLSLAVAHSCSRVDRVVIVNPATSFTQTQWSSAGQVLGALPEQVYELLPFLLSPVLVNPVSMAMHGVDEDKQPLEQAADLVQSLMRMLPELGVLRDALPAATLSFRLRLLDEGCSVVEPLLPLVSQRCLALVSDEDRLIPSEREGARLKGKMPRCRTRVLKGRSHAPLQEKGVNLMSVLKEEGFYVPRITLTGAARQQKEAQKNSGGNFGTAAALQLPTKREVQLSVDEASITLLRRAASPVFFSTDDRGRVSQGLGSVPVSGPVLLIGNHSLMAPDMPLMIEQFLMERGVMPRGLAHPAIFSSTSAAQRQSASFGSFLQTFGAVPVGGRNLHRLLENGEMALLYPGGAREALKLPGEEYQLIWPERAEFVRVAAKFGATIVPFAVVGPDEAYVQLLDRTAITRVPLLGDWLRRASQGVPSARGGSSGTLEDANPFLMPLVAPVPQRFYYIFRKPIYTRPDIVRDKASCQKVYEQVRAECEAGFDYLLAARQEDPYRDTLPRLAYELSWGGKRQAPTFKPR